MNQFAILASTALSTRPNRKSVDLSVASVIIPERKVAEGVLIKATSLVWAGIIKQLVKDWTKAFEIPSRVWEEIIAGAFVKARFDEVILTPRSNDHGRDVIAVRKGVGSIRILDSVKAYAPGHLVTKEEVHALMGVVALDPNASKGIFTTTSDFAPRLLDDPRLAGVDKIDETETPGTAETQNKSRLTKKRAIAEKLTAFGEIAGHAGKIVGQIGKAAKTIDLAIPGAGLVGHALEAVAEGAKTFAVSAPVSQRKADLVEDLKQLSRRIVVFIDDLDRLEPQEANEVLRLIRAVADFPNVVYVLSYDPYVLARTLESAIKIEDGTAYLKKIVQVSFRVPSPEAFDLRRLFEREVRELFFSDLEDFGGSDERRLLGDRLAQIVDKAGGRYLKTGRDIARALNALRLHGLPVMKSIDIPDMVWLQLVRIGNPDLYSWVEEYLITAAAVSNGALAFGAPEVADRLKKALDKEGSSYDQQISELWAMIPGISGGRKDGHAHVFDELHGAKLDEFVAFKRLGSPQHYRYYFAFSQPGGTLSDDDVQTFIREAEGGVQAAEAFAGLCDKVRPQGGTFGEVLIDRLIAWSDRVPEDAMPGILTAFANTLDDAVRSKPEGDWGEYPIWRAAARATAEVLKRSGGRRPACLRSLVEGRALGWLTNLLRKEIFSHGHHGDRRQPIEQRMLNPDEFREFLAEMLKRYERTPSTELKNVPNLLDLLFAWFQGSGSADGPRKWVQGQISTNTGLLNLLQRMRSWQAVNNAVQHPLVRSNVETFLNYEAARNRVLEMAKDSSRKAEQKLAQELVTAFEYGEGR